MAKRSDTKSSSTRATRRPAVKAPSPAPARKGSKTDAERLDDLLKKSATKNADDRSRGPGHKDD
jgi:hypothetical protein